MRNTVCSSPWVPERWRFQKSMRNYACSPPSVPEWPGRFNNACGIMFAAPHGCQGGLEASNTHAKIMFATPRGCQGISPWMPGESGGFKNAWEIMCQGGRVARESFCEKRCPQPRSRTSPPTHHSPSEPVALGRCRPRSHAFHWSFCWSLSNTRRSPGIMKGLSESKKHNASGR
jgi:hypothetical protein